MKTYCQFISEIKATTSNKLWVFDFDDTLAVSKGKIIVKNAKGEVTNSLRTDEFKTHKLKAGESYDFSDFASSSQATPIRYWMSVLQRVQKAGESYMILTARSLASPARNWLETQGIRNPHVIAVGGYDLYRIGDSRKAVATEKKRAVKQAIDRLGYTKVVVVDDSHQNIEDIQSIYGKNNPDSPIRTVLAKGKPQRPSPSKKIEQVAEARTTNSRYSKVFVLAHPTEGECTFVPSSKTGSHETSITANQDIEVKYPDAVSNKKIKILLKAQQAETTTLDVANRIWKELVKRGWKQR